MGETAKGDSKGWRDKRRRVWEARRINDVGSTGGREGAGENRRSFRSSKVRSCFQTKSSEREGKTRAVHFASSCRLSDVCCS